MVAAFLDLKGFRTWSYRAAIAPEIKEKFITEFYFALQNYVKNHHGSWSKYEGDGIITVREFNDSQRKDRRSVLNFILELLFLLKKVKKVLSESENSPDGVRIRIVDGYVYKLMVLDPNDPFRKRLIPEYLEYCTNTVRGLLEVNPNIPCLVTENLVRNLGKNSLKIRSLIRPSCYPKGVNKEDVDGLKIIDI